jgi:hypothetical protein
MSVTTTANTTTQSILHILADYELTHSGECQQSSIVDPPNPRSTDQEQPQNPDWWPDNYNAIPAYRPINYNLDRESRPWAQPGIETAFVWTMLNGVGIISVRYALLHIICKLTLCSSQARYGGRPVGD